LNLLSLGGSVLGSRFSIGSSVEVLSGGEDAARIRVDLLTRRGTAHDDVIHAVDARDFTADLEAGLMSLERWSVNLGQLPSKRDCQLKIPFDSWEIGFDI
jgi:hypothetical protein